MKLPIWMTTVTPISKIIAAILFVTLPFLGFLLGYSIPKTNDVNNTYVSSIVYTTKPVITNTPKFTETPTPTPTLTPKATASSTVTQPAPKTYDVAVYNVQGGFSVPSLNIKVNDLVRFTLSSASTQSFYMTVLDPNNKVVDSFGLNMETAAENHVPHTSNVFKKVGTYTVTEEDCLNTQCLSGNGTNKASISVFVK